MILEITWNRLTFAISRESSYFSCYLFMKSINFCYLSHTICSSAPWFLYRSCDIAFFPALLWDNIFSKTFFRWRLCSTNIFFFFFFFLPHTYYHDLKIMQILTRVARTNFNKYTHTSTTYQPLLPSAIHKHVTRAFSYTRHGSSFPRWFFSTKK